MNEPKISAMQLALSTASRTDAGDIGLVMRSTQGVVLAAGMNDAMAGRLIIDLLHALGEVAACQTPPREPASAELPIAGDLPRPQEVASFLTPDFEPALLFRFGQTSLPILLTKEAVSHLIQNLMRISQALAAKPQRSM